MERTLGLWLRQMGDVDVELFEKFNWSLVAVTGADHLHNLVFQRFRKIGHRAIAVYFVLVQLGRLVPVTIENISKNKTKWVKHLLGNIEMLQIL